jgi:hypothetical protein
VLELETKTYGPDHVRVARDKVRAADEERKPMKRTV